MNFTGQWRPGATLMIMVDSGWSNGMISREICLATTARAVQLQISVSQGGSLRAQGISYLLFFNHQILVFRYNLSTFIIWHPFYDLAAFAVAYR